VIGALELRIPEIVLEYRPARCGRRPIYRCVEIFAQSGPGNGVYSLGPHRADLAIRSDGRLAAPRLSRGQQKLVALMLKLAELDALRSGQYSPLLLLDDPVSELDQKHFAQLWEWLTSQAVQTWIAAVEHPPGAPGSAMFHVEQGQIRRMV
jgi:DNA replication and repair protein RecF